MIPKIIHYCWFGKKEKPDSVKKCIQTWRKNCPDYIIKEWNEDNFDINIFPFVKEAYAVKKYAFVSDVARLYALIQDGGIYMDTDVRLVKSFDDFLIHKSFIGKEKPLLLSTAVIAAEKGSEWVKAFFKRYENQHFITKNGEFNDIPNTLSLSNFYNNRYPSIEQELIVYDIEYFCAKIFPSGEYLITDKTVAIHEFSGSWVDKKYSLVQKIGHLLKRFL